MHRLEIERLTIWRHLRKPGRDAILSDISLSMSPGTILGVLGSNGTGKTSFLRAVAGFLPLLSEDAKRPSTSFSWAASWGDDERSFSGRVLLDGVDVTTRPPGERGLALVPQALALYPGKTVYENLASPLRIRRQPPEAVRARVAPLADRLGISAILQKYAHQISGGQQQRVALGRALVGEPRLLLLDEPLASLDQTTRDELLPFLADTLRSARASAVFVTHDATEAAVLCDNIAFLEDGRLAQHASPTEAATAPATPTIARSFAGFSNLLHGTRTAAGDFRLDDTPLTLEGILPPGTPDTPGMLAARPRALAIRTGDGQPDAFPLQHSFVLDGTPVGRILAGRHVITALLHGPLCPGQPVVLRPRPDACSEVRFFPA